LSADPESSPFLLDDVQLFVDKHRFDMCTRSQPDLVSATFISLAFSNKKTLFVARPLASDAVAVLTDAKINSPSAV
jgi:hypothetical protein